MFHGCFKKNKKALKECFAEIVTFSLNIIQPVPLFAFYLYFCNVINYIRYMATERILIVDDEETLCEVLKLNLENEGYDVDI